LNPSLNDLIKQYADFNRLKSGNDEMYYLIHVSSWFDCPRLFQGRSSTDPQKKYKTYAAADMDAPE
jgi:hypothetical protein